MTAEQGTFMSTQPLVLCVAAEASGDALLASLLPKLIAQAPRVRWEGIGGPLSVKAGLISHVNPETFSAHGVTEALSVLPAMLRALRVMSALLPSASGLLLIDAPELNMRLLKRASRLKIPVAYIAPPQAWAWRPWRAKRLRQASWIGCLFAFEAEWFRHRGLNAEHIGHPLASSFTPAQGAQLNAPYTLLLAPGSRRSTVNASLPLLLKSALSAINASPSTLERSIVVSVSPWVKREVQRHLRAFKEELSAQAVNLTLWDQLTPLHTGERRGMIALCHAGTVTLELGLAKVPAVAIAPLSPVSAFIARRLIHAAYFSLPNMILGQQVYHEVGPDRCNIHTLSDEAVKLSDVEKYNRVRSELSLLQSAVMRQNPERLSYKLVSLFSLPLSGD